MEELLLKLISLYHIVLGLLNDGLVPAVFLTDADSSGNTGCSPLGGTPVESKTLLDDVVHGGATLLK